MIKYSYIHRGFALLDDLVKDVKVVQFKYGFVLTRSFLLRDAEMSLSEDVLVEDYIAPLIRQLSRELNDCCHVEVSQLPIPNEKPATLSVLSTGRVPARMTMAYHTPSAGTKFTIEILARQ